MDTSLQNIYPPSQKTESVSSRMNAKKFLLRRDFAPDEAVGEETPHARLRELHSNFVRELKLAKRGKKTSLPFIWHELRASGAMRGQAMAVVVGGSRWERAIIQQQPIRQLADQQLQLDQGELPVFHTKEEFLEFMWKKIPQDVQVVGLNFAYPLQPVLRDGLLDGRLMTGTKEHAFEGLRGKLVGKEIEDFLAEGSKDNAKRIRVAVANDTVCLALSGLTEYQWNQVAGGVVGTGLNFALFLGPGEVVNLESAMFDKFTQSEEGKIIDARSKERGASLFEKEVSGKYLYEHYNARTKNVKLKTKRLKETKELSGLAQRGDPAPEQARYGASALAREILQRSAEMVAAQVAGIVTFLGRDTTFVMEGSLFWKGWNYKQTVMRVARELEPHYKIKFVQIENSGLVGAGRLISF